MTISTSTPQNTTPFTSLFQSTTRPIPTSTKQQPTTPYLILFQHSQQLTQRIIAAEPSQNSNIYKNANLQTPKTICNKDTRGDLFIQQAWTECVQRCNGRVILIQDGNINFQQDKAFNTWNLMKRHGVVIDLWNRDSWELQDDIEMNQDIKVLTANGILLEHVLQVIQDASQYIETVNSGDNNENSELPIPIIFESSTPFLIHHGMERLILLLTKIKQTFRNVGPIFIPSLMELSTPLENRQLEEIADAVMTLNGGKVSIVKRSARNGGMISTGFSGGLRLIKEVQQFELKGNNAATELVLLKKNTDVSMNHSENQKNNKTKIKSGDQDNTDIVAKQTQGLEIRPTPDGHKHKTSRRPVLKHENEKETVNESRSTPESIQKQAPRIFMEEDDPEFDDLDEEDPDDDLDI
ncbi:hypothetical protein CTEN210_13109 [Chaetoceros tenuissimus]|uniref:Elongator complex protein 5 n=1 Tax=Chaetoceros tenuissimus TaxID=426638 RepID=A0AAD3D2N0_9STRA|nr:hypothetical protein CTEN210_13109 [Chaetoceros tenuissimus]